MPNLKIKFGKQIFDMSSSSLEELKNKIWDIIHIPVDKIKFIKPTLKDQKGFAALKDGTEILIMGTPIEKQVTVVEKIQQNGIAYKTNIGSISYVTSTMHMFKTCPEFRRFCKEYPVNNKNPDGLFAQDIGKLFTQIQEVDPTGNKPVSPIDIITSWIAYAEDFGDYPYQIYDAIECVQRLMEIMALAAVSEEEAEKEPNKENIIKRLFEFTYDTEQQQTKTELGPDWAEELFKGKRENQTSFYLGCEVSKDAANIYQGIHNFNKNKQHKLKEVYGIDVEYVETRGELKKRLPEYAVIYLDRIHHCTKTSKDKEPGLMKYPRVIDLFEFCDADLKKSLKDGRDVRDTYFKGLETGPEYGEFIKKLPGAAEMTEAEKHYTYAEHRMTPQQYENWIFPKDETHNKLTGEYWLVGLMTHEGPRIVNETGFKAVVSRKGKGWYSFKDDQVKTLTGEDAMSYAGGEDNRAEVAHVLLYKSFKY